MSLLFALGAAATTTAVVLAGSGFGGAGAPAVANAAGDPVIAAVGDIACDPGSPSYNGGAGATWECRQRYTSDLAVGAGLTAVLGLGDLQYEDGTWAKFTQSYEASWGRVKSITYPAPGNHEYDSPGAAGYYDYFGARAGDRAKGYYSFDVGAWHLIALNSECGAVGGCGPGSPQLSWLIQDLQLHSSSACTLAFWHHPRFSSGRHGSDLTYHAFWQALYDHDADVVLVGHDHDYERFAPQTPDGAADPVRGIRQFVVGTGGKNLRPFEPANLAANSEVRESATFGILKLTLHATSYDWAFVPEAGRTFTDTGSGTCHTPPAPTAAFSGSPTAGTAPLSVVFSDQSTGTPTSWAWDFDGNGTVDSTLRNPAFTYTAAGTYTVTLTASNAHGSDNEVKTGYVVVSAPPQPPPAAPTAAFSGSPTSGTAPLTVAFSNTSSDSATAWAWDFDGNGTVDSTLRNPSFTYSAAGVYTVTLTASNAHGSDTEVKAGYISVAAAAVPPPQPPPGPEPPPPQPPPPQPQPPQPQPQPTVTRHSLAPSADGYAGAARARTLLVRGARDAHRAYLTFARDRVRGVLRAASLRLYVSDPSASQLTVRRCSAGWTEAQLGKGTKPRLLGPALARVRPANRGRWLELRIPLGAVPARGPLCLALSAPGSDTAAFGSRESRQPPRLVLTT